jgi:formate-nitrite transporter family protein
MAEDEATLNEAEERDVEERSAPRARIVHAAVVRQGKDELDRPLTSLFWSGVAAGVAIIASLSTEAGLHHRLPDAPWREAVSGLGYSLGFLIVILGRMQLFTEQTMVAVLPLAQAPSLGRLGRVARLWGAVLIGNLVGAALITAAAAYGHLQSEEMTRSMIEISARLQERTALATFLQAIPAGFLIASVAWIRSAANENAFWIVLALTYAIAIGGFAHVVAGATEAFFLLWSGRADLGWVAVGFLLPALAGNIVGGTGLFAMLAHAQVKEEL